ncbi:hypothetical protein Salat_0474600 [Sesamum alatum]|uniref:C2H2-type domain-containing protein n=1 Tax=Sesamum alatum TaxID=300844 RepID=A0AAE1Z3W6_9LAMI|nr:hypothetical protein Salat_0474600 [Sesamum alatum]
MELETLNSGLQCVQDTSPGFVLTFPGWLKTGRRTRAGKGSDQDLFAPDDLEIVKQNLPLKKRKFESFLLSNVRKIGCPRSEKDDGNVNPGLECLETWKDSLVVEGTIACKVPVRAPKLHVCDLCDRSFKSYQALGGHKAHHKDDGFSTSVDSLVARAERKVGCWGLIHRCPFCDKGFLKGQALGGHKRHCRRPEVEMLYPGGGQTVTLNESRGFGFDLNELPPELIYEEMESGKMMKV